MSGTGGELVRYVDPRLAEQVEATYAEREVFEEINARVAARDSIESIIAYVFEATRSITPCDRIGTAFLDRDGRIVAHCVATAYEPVLLKRGYAEDLRASSLQTVLERGWPRVINDLEAYCGSPSQQLFEWAAGAGRCPLESDLSPAGRRPHCWRDVPQCAQAGCV